MTVTINGDTGITSPGLDNTANTTLGDASGDTVTINAATVSTPNGLNFDSNTFVIDAANNYVGIGTSSPSRLLDIATSNAGGSTLVSLVSATDGNCQLLFGDTASDTQGKVLYNNSGDYMTLYTAGSERMRIDSSGNVGIGISSPSYKLDVYGSSEVLSRFVRSGGSNALLLIQDPTTTSAPYIGSYGNAMAFGRYGGGESMRIDSSGNLLVGKTTTSSATAGVTLGSLPNFIANTPSPSDGPYIQIGNIASSVVSGFRYISFRVNAGGTEVGSISTNGSSTTSYNTSSDYRLKENIAPMTGALDTVAALKPCTYTWKADGSSGQGFIAHELQAVVPDCVTGEKDAVDADGNPKYQGVDTSFLVATLTAAIQELSTKLDEANARIAALENK